MLNKFKDWVVKTFTDNNEVKEITLDDSADMPVLDEHGVAEDPFVSAIVNQAFRSGKPVVANRLVPEDKSEI
jgi:hypothetical protein